MASVRALIPVRRAVADLVESGPRRQAFERRQQISGGLLHVGDDTDLGGNQAADEIGVNAGVDGAGVGRNGGRLEGHLGAEIEHQIELRRQRRHHVVAEEQRMVGGKVGEQTLGLHRRKGQTFGERDHRRVSLAAGDLRPDEQERVLRLEEQPCRPLDELRVGRHLGRDDELVAGNHRRARGGRRKHVSGERQGDRSLGRGGRDREGAARDLRDALDVTHAPTPTGEAG